MAKQSRYPSFHVMNGREEWDPHTRSIVTSRLEPQGGYRFFTLVEAEIMIRICSLLVNDSDREVLHYVVSHMDRTLYQSPGEGQRKAGVPEASVLVRSGLHAVELGAELQYGTSFLKLDTPVQQKYLQQISESAAGPRQVWEAVPQAEWFRKVLQGTIEAYCSHPKVWSEIGYAGPAYPRGYIRTQLGQLEPWEAQPEQC